MASRIRCLIATGLCMCVWPAWCRAASYTDSVAAIAGDEVITVFDLHRETRPIEMDYRKRFVGETLRQKVMELRNDALQRLIERELIYAEFLDMGGKVPAELTQRRLDRIVVSQCGGDRAKFEERLQSEGLNVEEFEAQIEKMIAVDLLLREKVYRHATVAPEAVEEQYRTNLSNYQRPARLHLRMIELKSAGKHAPDLDKTMEQVRAALDEGKDFGAVAAEFSEGANAAQGGDLGWIETTEANPDFLRAVAGLQPGGVAEPLRIEGNLYLLKLEDRQGGGIRPLDEQLKREIEGELTRLEETRRHREFVAELRQKYYVKTYF